MATRDYDFIGFSFKGRHSIDDFGIYRTSDGDRYNDNLIPQLSEKTADIPGGDGQHYFSTHYKSKVFSIPIAFNSLSETQYSEVRHWLNGKEIGELIFDEMPFKVYSAKVTGTPSLKTICFMENGERVYKGEGNIQFTCYYPYAHTPKYTKNGLDGRALQSYYVNSDYPNKQEWAKASGMDNQFVVGTNHGDIPAVFTVTCDLPTITKNDVFSVGEHYVKIQEDLSFTNLTWDSRTGLVTAIPYEVNSNLRTIRVSGHTYGGIPITQSAKPVGVRDIYYRSENEGITYFIDGTYITDSGKTGVLDPVFTLDYYFWYL